MKTKFRIIETAEYYLAVSDEEIKKGDKVYWTDPEGLTSDLNTVISVSEEILFLSEPNSSELECYVYECKKIIAHQPTGNAPELDLPLLPEMVVRNHISEDRIYCVDVQNYEFDTAPQTWDDEKFISEAEIQGNVYSLEGFITAFNKTEINQDNLIIRLVKA